MATTEHSINDASAEVLRRLYVAGSRPRHLLCTAMHKDNISDEQIAQREALGWNAPPALGAEGHG